MIAVMKAYVTISNLPSDINNIVILCHSCFFEKIRRKILKNYRVVLSNILEKNRS
jgi:hypothetical protein